jgi:hypothetical protein
MRYISIAVLLLLLAGYTLYITRLLWIPLVQTWRRFRKPLRPGVRLTYAVPNDSEDCDGELLWETQLPALVYLRSVGSRGVSKARMAKLYCEFARVYPELCDGSTYLDWIDALENAAVAVYCCSGVRIAITEKGRSILAGLERRRVPQNVPPFPISRC